MANLDLAMPLALFAVILVAFFFNKRSEKKLKVVFEERELQTKDIILLAVMITVTISATAIISTLYPGQILQNIILFVIIVSYSMLLFVFSYLFSNLRKKNALIFSLIFCSIGFIVGTISLFNPFYDDFALIRRELVNFGYMSRDSYKDEYKVLKKELNKDDLERLKKLSKKLEKIK